jgi:hypothetical protein
MSGPLRGNRGAPHRGRVSNSGDLPAAGDRRDLGFAILKVESVVIVDPVGSKNLSQARWNIHGAVCVMIRHGSMGLPVRPPAGQRIVGRRDPDSRAWEER